MTQRQKATYDLILRNSEVGVETTQEEIIGNYPASDHGDGYRLSDNPNAHDKCFPVWSDITALNTSWEAEKIIIIDGFKYRMGSYEETMEYRESLRKKALRALVKVSCITRKIRSDKQGLLPTEEEASEDAERFLERFVNHLDGNE